MKHIKKKFLFQTKIDQSGISKLNGIGDAGDLNQEQKKFSNKKDYYPILITETDYLIQGFFYSTNGNHYVIPEPDQVLIYFHNAQSNYRLIKETKKELLQKIIPNSNLNEDVANSIFNFFGLTSGCIIFLFSAMEAFLNSLIPDEYVYESILKNRTELYNKEQVQKHLQFDEKLKKVIPEIHKKDFIQKYPSKAVFINNLKDFRDELIHPKHTPGVNRYENISKKALNFKYEETICAVRDFMNFYREDYIIECDCGIDR